MDLSNKIKAAAEYIKGKSKYNPTIGLILGSGLGAIADQIEDAEYFPYNEIPNFPVSTVEGHAGRLVIGKFQGKEVVAMQGRFHYYEGYSMQEVTCPVRVMRLLGVETLVVTNAAGAVNKDYTPGDLMIISDHLNLSGSNPLIGKNLNEFGTRFPDMSNAYDKDLRAQVKDIAKNLGESVNAALDGKVISAGYNNGGYGNLIVIEHQNNMKTYYAHLNEIYVNVGDMVKKDDIIGAVGSTGNSTGPHLHFELRVDNKPVDPIKYIKQ